jgi:hypothetical protein
LSFNMGVLHNPIGHFSIFPPLQGCGNVCLLPSFCSFFPFLSWLLLPESGSDQRKRS